MADRDSDSHCSSEAIPPADLTPGGLAVHGDCSAASVGGAVAEAPVAEWPAWQRPVQTGSLDMPMAAFPSLYSFGSSDPLSVWLSGEDDGGDSSGFGLRSVSDSSFCTRRPTREQWCLLRSHHLLQAEAVRLAAAPRHSHLRQHFMRISGELSRRVRQTVQEHMSVAMQRARAVTDPNAGLQRRSIVQGEQCSCHRMLAAILDQGTLEFRTMADMCSLGAVDDGGASAIRRSNIQAPSSFGLGQLLSDSQQVRRRRRSDMPCCIQ